MKKRATAIIICILLFINHVSAAVLYEFGNLEDAKEWVREIGTEYYEDSDYFDSYNEQLDVFYNSDDMIYLDKGYETDTYEATEDNFYKAYDECVRLFRGGND